MNSWGSVIFLLLILLGAVYFYLKKSNKLPSWLPNLFASDPEKTVASLKERTEQEKAKQIKLQKILDAKEELFREKTMNSQLTKKIASIKESPVYLIKKPVEDRRKNNAKV